MVGSGSICFDKNHLGDSFQRGFSTNPFGTLARGTSQVCHSGSKSKNTEYPVPFFFFFPPLTAGVIYSLPMSGTLLCFSYLIKVLQNMCSTEHTSLAPARVVVQSAASVALHSGGHGTDSLLVNKQGCSFALNKIKTIFNSRT